MRSVGARRSDTESILEIKVSIDQILSGLSADYYALLARADDRPNCQVYAWSVRQPLPKIPVPLRAPDPDALIDLAAVFATTYDRGRYARAVDYTAAPETAQATPNLQWITHQATAK